MCKRRVIFYALAATLASPILFGINCPPTPPPGGVPTTLLDVDRSLPGGCTIITACPGAAAGSADTFNPTSVGKQITVVVAASLTNSRPQIEIQDLFGNVVANSGVTPTTNSTTVNFTSNTTGLHILAVCECSANLSPTYAMDVTQAP